MTDSIDTAQMVASIEVKNEPMPVLTVMLHRFCDNDADRFDQLTALLRIVQEQTLQLEGTRADVLAYLARKIDNAQKVIDTHNDKDGSARQMQRGWEIMREDISAGLHVGDAE